MDPPKGAFPGYLRNTQNIHIIGYIDKGDFEGLDFLEKVLNFW